MPQGYRNARTGYLTDLLVDTTPVGAVVPNLKAGRNSLDHFEKPDISATFPKLGETSGNAYLNADDPAWTHEGYLYCDGSIHNIGDYPQLFEIIGNLYGGAASNGVDVITGGSGYSTSSTVTVSAPPTGGTQAVVTVGSVDGNGAITSMSITNAGSGYTTAPTVSVATGTGATFQVRFDSIGGAILGISKNNVMDHYGDLHLGTFGVPDTKCRKIVGNGPVYGANSPNSGNSTMGSGTTGGKWFIDQSAQDNYFSLGTIRTSGYENVVETTECSIIGSQTVKVTMRETKLSGAHQHTHLLYNSIPGSSQWIQEYSGDRYLVHYKAATGKIDRWYPTTGEVFTHNHGLLRQPIADPEVASYDVLDYEGGRGGVGSIQNPYDSSGNAVPYADQKYMASGDSSAGTTQLQVSIPDPVMKRFTPTSLIGGRQITSGGVPVYDYTNIVVDSSSPGSGSANITVTGTPDLLIYNLMGGGGSGACGTTAGNAGGDSWLKIGPSGSEVINITAKGGEAGKASQAQNGGGATTAAQAITSGSQSITGTNGAVGTAGANTTYLVTDNPTDPGGGGTGGSGQTFVQNGTVYGAGSNGKRGKTNDSGSLTQTKTSGTHTFDISSVTANPSEVKFTLEGASGAESSLDTYANPGSNQSGGKGAWVQCFLNSSTRSTFRSNTWSVKIGTASTTRDGGTGPLGSSQQGGYGGTGYSGAHGGGGGSSALLYRGSVLIAGAGGGGGAGADGYDNGDGQSGGANSGNAAGITGGSLRKVAGNTGLDAGFGGTGGHYGCRGGGGGGGGAGAAENGFSGFGGGGAGGDPGSGGHDGGDGGQQGPSAIRTLYFEDSTANTSSHTNEGASIKMEVTWDGSYWQAAGGGGGGGAYFKGNISWSQLGNPSSISYQIGGAGNGVSNGGQSTGNAGSGYIKVAIGTITGYTGGTTTTTTGDLVTLASQTSTSFDVNIFSGGAGTGTAGFKLPTTQVPTVVFQGGGLASGATTHATATCTVSSTLHKVTGITLGTTAGTNSGYTETPYVYVLGGAGTLQKCSANIDASSGAVSTLVYSSANSEKAERYLKFGGTVANTRWVETIAFDTSNANYFTIKACRGNGINGGDVPEESLLLYYQLAGTTTWSLLDTIINPSSARTDPLIGNVPKVTQGDATWDGGSGDTKWHSYSVAIPSTARGANTKFKLEQIRTATGSDNSNDSDHYGIAEIVIYNQKTSTYVFVPDPGGVSRPLVDELSYTVYGESGPGFTYTSGLGASDATLTLKSTTKVEPVATIDPDYDIPLVHPYHVCKYLIKAF